jgi:hypothetical protein
MSDRPPRRRLVLVTLGAALLVVLVSLPLFVLPAVDEPEDVRARPVDAVVVLGGGGGERLPTGLGLLGRLTGPPPVLLLSLPYEPPLLTCGTVPGHPNVEVECLRPDPLTTSGEAADVTSLAAERGWQRLVVVTSDYHVTRSRVLFSRCADRLAPDLQVLWVGAASEPLTLRGAWSIATEWPSLLGTPWDHQDVCSGEPTVGT